MNQIKAIKSLSKRDVRQKIQRVKKSFINIPVVVGNNHYPYSFFSLTDFYPPMDPTLMEDMADLLVYFGHFTHIDLIVSEADRGGGPLTQMVSLKTGIPYTLANWYPVKAKGVLSIQANVGFSGHGNISIFSIEKHQNIILVDDMISSGGTAEALIKAIKKAGAHINEALFVVEKANLKGREKIEKKYNIHVISLVKIIAENGFTKEIK